MSGRDACAPGPGPIDPGPAFLRAYLLWQQLPVHPLLQQLCPHLSWQQDLHMTPLAKDTLCASVAMARTTLRPKNTNVRFI